MPRKKKSPAKKTISEVENDMEAKQEEQEEETPITPIISSKPTKPRTAHHYPNKNELLIGTCTKITSHGAYFLLDGYEEIGNTAGFVHISELSKARVRNIRKHVKEGQKSVFKVLRINPKRNEVDLSIRRVGDKQRREYLKIFKQESRARALIKIVSDKFNLTQDDIEGIFDSMHEAYGTNGLYIGLETIRDLGFEEFVTRLGMDKDLAEALEDVASKELERASVTLNGKITCSISDRNGLKVLQESMKDAIQSALDNEAMEVSIHNISAPDYRVILKAEDWKVAENSWKVFQDKFESLVSPYKPLSLEMVRIKN